MLQILLLALTVVVALPLLASAVLALFVLDFPRESRAVGERGPNPG